MPEKYAIKTTKGVQRGITTNTMHSKSLNVCETMTFIDFANYKKNLISNFSTKIFFCNSSLLINCLANLSAHNTKVDKILWQQQKFHNNNAGSMKNNNFKILKSVFRLQF